LLGKSPKIGLVNRPNGSHSIYRSGLAGDARSIGCLGLPATVPEHSLRSRWISGEARSR
jgi:hypothetical protein